MKKTALHVRRLSSFLLLFSSIARAEPAKFVRSQVMMGDVSVSITLVASPEEKGEAFAAMERAFAEARRLERVVSEWQPKSETSEVNRQAGKGPVKIGRDLMSLLQLSKKVALATDGAFDITFPSSDRRASWHDLKLDPRHLTAALPAGRKIAVSGIAKGYIVDRMSSVLRRAGFKNFLVNAGDLYASGRDGDHPWTVGIANPKDPRGRPLCTLKIENRAVSTSGTYERGNHIINPKTHRPVNFKGSTTVVADQSVIADALATGAFVMGRQALASRAGIFGPRVDVLVGCERIDGSRPRATQNRDNR